MLSLCKESLIIRFWCLDLLQFHLFKPLYDLADSLLNSPLCIYNCWIAGGSFCECWPCWWLPRSGYQSGEKGLGRSLIHGKKLPYLPRPLVADGQHFHANCWFCVSCGGFLYSLAFRSQFFCGKSCLYVFKLLATFLLHLCDTFYIKKYICCPVMKPGLIWIDKTTLVRMVSPLVFPLILLHI